MTNRPQCIFRVEERRQVARKITADRPRDIHAVSGLNPREGIAEAIF
jgi:hypothetical protein